MSKEKNNPPRPDNKPKDTKADGFQKREGAVKGNNLPTYQAPPPPPPPPPKDSK